jgi:hypothetical protein
MQQKSLMDQYPSSTAAGPLLHPTEAAYFKEHTEANTEEQLKSLANAMEFSREPARWYEEQLQADFKVCRAWCNKHRIPVEYKEPLHITTRLVAE